MFNYKYPHMAVTVDLVLFDTSKNVTYILLIERKQPPYQGSWAIPGGYVDIDETVENAAKRELLEETGAYISSVNFIGYFDQINRDPRERTVSFAFWASTDGKHQEINPGDDAKEAEWFDITNLPELAFDHQYIVNSAIKKYYKLS